MSRVTTLKSLSVGGTSLVEVPTTLGGTQSSMARSRRLDGNLGLPVYSRFRLIVDEPHDRLWFAPTADAARPFEVNHTGLLLQDSASGAKVAYVAPGSPGQVAGLNADDIIVAIDGAPIERAPRENHKADEWIYGAPGIILRVGLASGQTKSLTLASYF